MKTTEGHGSFWDLLIELFYRVERVEYIRLAPTQPSWWKEYLILYYERRAPFISSHRQVIKSAIRFSEKRFFREQLERFRIIGVQIETRNLSLEEFAKVAKVHPLLKNDPWVKEDLPRALVAERLNNTR